MSPAARCPCCFGSENDPETARTVCCVLFTQRAVQGGETLSAALGLKNELRRDKGERGEAALRLQ